MQRATFSFAFIYILKLGGGPHTLTHTQHTKECLVANKMLSFICKCQSYAKTSIEYWGTVGCVFLVHGHQTL